MIRIYPVRKALFPRHVFRISRAARPRVDNIFLVLEQDGMLGYGEASPNAYFREDAFDVSLTLNGLADFFLRQTLRSTTDIAHIWAEVRDLVSPSRACLCAVDLALWDLLGKLTGRPVSDLVHGRPPRPVPTSATIGICPPEEWAGRVSEASGFPAIKVKVGADLDLGLLDAVRAGSGAAIRVDANCAWNSMDPAAMARASAELASRGVEFLEQPLPREDDGRMPEILAASRLPILADESCATPEEVEALDGRFSGFNIKLVKCGGLTPALAMLETGRRLGLKVMVGCMLESSLLIAAGAVAAQDADYADLDGAWLLRNDPFAGLALEEGRLRLSDAPGLGVNPREEYT